MDPPRFFVFTPVPLRARRDGWTADLQLRFVELLAAGVKPGAAARRLGKNRQNAYALRRRPGAESFAAAWDEASAYAMRSRIAPDEPPPPAPALPAGAAAEAVAERGHQAVLAARTRTSARRALTSMLDELYGPKGSTATTATKVQALPPSPGDPNLCAPARRTVAFRGAPLRRHPC
jgi:hypothetical protein